MPGERRTASNSSPTNSKSPIKSPSQTPAERGRTNSLDASLGSLQANPLASLNPSTIMSFQRTIGNQAVQRLIKARTPGTTSPPASATPAVGAPIQRLLQKTTFGTYWVVDEKSPTTEEEQQAEQLSAEEFTKLQELANGLSSEGGFGSLIIAGDKFFKSKVADYLHKLMTKPDGRRLVAKLARGSMSVTIKALDDPMDGEQARLSDTKADPTVIGVRKNKSPDVSSKQAKVQERGLQSDAVVEIDPNLNDDSVMAYDKDFNPIKQPAFITLGHELIHARHITKGMIAQRDKEGWEPSVPEYDDMEEEETINTGNPMDKYKLSENKLRAEHQYSARHGHGGYDTRGKTSLHGEFTLADIAAAAGIEVSGLFAANPKLADQLLDRNPELAESFVGQAGSGIRDNIMAKTPDDSVLAFHLHERFDLLKPLLPGDSALAAKVILGKHADKTVMDAYGDVQDVLAPATDQYGTAELEQKMDQKILDVLIALPRWIDAILGDDSTEDKLKDNLEDEKVAVAVFGSNADLKTRLSLIGMGKDKIVQESGGSDAAAILSHYQDLAQLKAPSSLKIPNFATHMVRRIESSPETKQQIIETYELENDTLLKKFNPRIKNWNSLKIGESLVIPGGKMLAGKV